MKSLKKSWNTGMMKNRGGTLKRNRLNERQRTQKASYIRRMEIEQMSERKPLSKARDDFKRPAYHASSMIAEQGKQMEHVSVEEHLAKK